MRRQILAAKGFLRPTCTLVEAVQNFPLEGSLHPTDRGASTQKLPHSREFHPDMGNLRQDEPCVPRSKL